MQKLIFGLMEVATTLFGYIEFDRYRPPWRMVAHRGSHLK